MRMTVEHLLIKEAHRIATNIGTALAKDRADDYYPKGSGQLTDYICPNCFVDRLAMCGLHSFPENDRGRELVKCRTCKNTVDVTTVEKAA